MLNKFLNYQDKDFISQKFSEEDFCPICGELLFINNEEHICSEEILKQIEEIELNKNCINYRNDSKKTFGEKLQDADLMCNYYDIDDEEENEDDNEEEDNEENKYYYI